MTVKDAASSMERSPSTGISILVVGAGIAGLTLAIEASRKGHSVRVIEKRPTLDTLGDMIGIQHSALRTPTKWPGFMESFDAITCDAPMTIKKFDGAFIGTFPVANAEHPARPVFRPDLHKLFYDYAAALGIAVAFDRTVVRYYEDSDQAGVELSDGSHMQADVVVSSDGLGSKSWTLVTGEKSQPYHSGFSVYRVSYPTEVVRTNPVIAEELAGRDDYLSFFLGHDSHTVVCVSKARTCWLLTRRDHGESSEGWSPTASIDDALPHVKGWAPVLAEFINCTPGKAAVDWKLMWRDPQPNSVSPLGRVVQIGDSAHAFLPTSGAGATMAMEDAYSLATCLQMAGKRNIPLALRVHNKLRFERVACAQKMGLKNRDGFHNTNWDTVHENPKPVSEFVPNWLVSHDPEQYAEENFENCARHITEDVPFENTNFPRGYTYKPWKVKDLIEASGRGEALVDEGDWS